MTGAIDSPWRRPARALPLVAGWARRTADVPRHRWPDANQDLTDCAKFPPYSPHR
jgi:hypothetical protein